LWKNAGTPNNNHCAVDLCDRRSRRGGKILDDAPHDAADDPKEISPDHSQRRDERLAKAALRKLSLAHLQISDEPEQHSDHDLRDQGITRARENSMCG